MCLGHGGGCDAWFDAPRRGDGGRRASPCRGRTARQARKPKKRCATVRRRSSSRGKDRPMKQSKPLTVIVALGALLGTLGGLLTVSPALASVPAGVSQGWSVTPSPNPVIPTGQLFWVSCPAASSCMAVGTYTQASGAGVTLAEKWNGTAWRILRVAVGLRGGRDHGQQIGGADGHGRAVEWQQLATPAGAEPDGRRSAD